MKATDSYTNTRSEEEEDTRGRQEGQPHPSSPRNWREFNRVIALYENLYHKCQRPQDGILEGLDWVVHDYKNEYMNGDYVKVVKDPKYARFSIRDNLVNYDLILNFHQTSESFDKKFGEAIAILTMKGWIKKK
jgi:hypothetical protein